MNWFGTFSCVVSEWSFLIAYKGNDGKIYFTIRVNAFQIAHTTCFENVNGSQEKLKLHLLSCLKDIFISQTLPKQQ